MTRWLEKIWWCRIMHWHGHIEWKTGKCTLCGKQLR